MSNDIYESLRAHLDVMPVAFPPSESGVEIEILKRFFTEQEARVALELSMLPESAQKVFRRVKRRGRRAGAARRNGRADASRRNGGNRGKAGAETDGAGPSYEEVEGHLESLAAKKVINCEDVRTRRGRRRVYGKLPFAVGMYEFQVDRLTPGFEAEAQAYMSESFIESFVREHPRQMRTIPINETILPDRSVSRYDSIRELIRGARGPFVLQNCICRQGRELSGEECRQTDMKETCLVLGPAARDTLAEGRGSRMTREETLEFLERAEEAGLVLQGQNTREPVFICCCCSCCCAILSRVKHMPNPGELLRSPYAAVIQPEVCTGCGLCVERCPMGAIRLEKKAAEAGSRGSRAAVSRAAVSRVNVSRAAVSRAAVKGEKARVEIERCIGCGLCVGSCPTQAIALERKEGAGAKDPPGSIMSMYARMFVGRFGLLKGALLLLKAGIGFKV